MILEARPELEVVGEAEDGFEAIEATRRLLPDVILMDVRMPNLDGVEATRGLVARGTDSRILILTTFDLDEYVYEAIRAGASGFLLKDVRPQGSSTRSTSWPRATRSSHRRSPEGCSTASSRKPHKTTPSHRRSSLTERELEPKLVAKAGRTQSSPRSSL